MGTPCEEGQMTVRTLARKFTAVAAALWLLLPCAVAQAPTAPTEAAVKAAYLYRFLAYVDWPAEALPASGEPIVVGVLGSEAVAQALPGILAGRQVNGRPVVSRSLASATAPLERLHALFIGRSVDAPKVLPRLGNRPVLVVTEDEIEAGGMLNFVVVDGRVRFEAAPVAAEAAGLKLSARLLAIAERVHKP
jgi:hypothetical protein